MMSWNVVTRRPPVSWSVSQLPADFPLPWRDLIHSPCKRAFTVMVGALFGVIKGATNNIGVPYGKGRAYPIKCEWWAKHGYKKRVMHIRACSWCSLYLKQGNMVYQPIDSTDKRRR